MGILRHPLIAADGETVSSVPLPSALVSLQRNPLGSPGAGGSLDTWHRVVYSAGRREVAPVTAVLHYLGADVWVRAAFQDQPAKLWEASGFCCCCCYLLEIELSICLVSIYIHPFHLSFSGDSHISLSGWPERGRRWWKVR